MDKGVAILTLGLSVSTIFGAYGTDTPLICGNDLYMPQYGAESHVLHSNTVINENEYNIYSEKNSSSIEAEAEEIFGIMRSLTIEERESIESYMESKSIKTGVSFFDLC